MDTSDIWEKIIIPLLIGPIFVFFKVLYDTWHFKKKESVILKNKIKLEKLNNKLTKFFWPLYILLLKDFDLWSKIIFKESSNIDITESDSDSDMEFNNSYKYCIYMRKINGILCPCKNPVAINCLDKNGPYCIKHQCFKNKKIIESISVDYSNKNRIILEKNNSVIDYLYNYDKNDITNISLKVEDGLEKKKKDYINATYIKSYNTKKENDNDSNESLNKEISNIDNSLENNNIINNLPGNITGNKIGEIEGLNISNRISSYDIKSNMILEIISNLETIHKQINNIIIENISIGEPNTKIGKQLIKYIKFTNIFLAESKTEDLVNPAKYGAPYPKKLLPMIEIELFKLQKDYNKLVQNYYEY